MLGTIILVIGIVLVFGSLSLPLIIVIYQGVKESNRNKRAKESKEKREERNKK